VSRLGRTKVAKARGLDVPPTLLARSRCSALAWPLPLSAQPPTI